MRCMRCTHTAVAATVGVQLPEQSRNCRTTVYSCSFCLQDFPVLAPGVEAAIAAFEQDGELQGQGAVGALNRLVFSC